VFEALGCQKARNGSASPGRADAMNIEKVPKHLIVMRPAQKHGKAATDSTRAKITLFGSTGAL